MPTIRPAALLCLLPFFTAAPCDAQETRTMSNQNVLGVISMNGKTEHVWIDTRKGIEVRAGGLVALREDAPDVERLAENGYLTVQQQVGSARHRAEWRAAPGGGMTRTYTVDGERRSFAEARPWLDRFFPEILRTTSIGAEARAQRILAERGVSALIAEIPRLESGSVRKVYVEEALRSGRLRPEDTRALLQGIAGISSSSDKREMLSVLAGSHGGTAEFWPEWLRAVGTVSSGSDRRELLAKAVRELPHDQAPPAALFTALDGIPSSSDRREVLLALVAKWGGSAPTLQRTLGSTARLNSSSDRREVLGKAAKSPALGSVLPQYLDVVEGMGSSSDRREALGAVLRNPALPQSRDASVQWLRAVGKTKSDSDKATLLMSAVDRLPADRAVRAAFAAAVETISSDTYYNQVATAFLRSQVGRS
ncbi:MAG TPA: hypothetical protein VGR37_13670 [Longimicrobiaceae bacterium]|nr:hypothetical protein [Longimicrobiaceae bacterium]